jgi:hypothetical protein
MSTDEKLASSGRVAIWDMICGEPIGWCKIGEPVIAEEWNCGASDSDRTVDLPEGCTCHIREDLDWGEILVQPPEGCTIHRRHALDCQINKPVPTGYPWPTFSCNCEGLR